MHVKAEAIQAAIAEIAAIDDPVERAAAASDALALLHDANKTLATRRRADLKALHEGGLSYRKIRDLLEAHGAKLTFARIGQIISGEPTGIGVPGRTPKGSRATQSEGREGVGEDA